MDLLHGHSLDELRRSEGGSLPLPDVLRFACELLDVLAHTHELGVVHRDLKPSNLFVEESGQLKVLDFGIASSALELTEGTQRTLTRGLLGTPAYMAPEQARGRWDLVDHRTDLWAVGATIFTLASGQYVHMAVTENERLGLAMSRPARSLASVLPGAARDLIEVVDRSLAYEAGDRFQSASEFRHALGEVRASEGVEVPPSARDATLRDATGASDRRAGSRRRVALAGLVGVSLAATAALSLDARPVVTRGARSKPPHVESSPARPGPNAIAAPPSPAFDERRQSRCWRRRGTSVATSGAPRIYWAWHSPPPADRWTRSKRIAS
jgi:serine/threonine protein kinase